MMRVQSIPPGQLVGRDFRVQHLLAEGGFGSVYEAEQLSTGRRRALKVLHPTLVNEPRQRERFLEEARVSAKIENPHIVEVISAGIDEPTGAPFIALELLQGETLAKRIERTGGLSRKESADILLQLGSALEAAHAVGLVHRDLKPDNIFLATGPQYNTQPFVKVLDFGIAKFLGEGNVTTPTQTSIGTPLWMAPEQVDAGAISQSTDIWPLALIAFQMLTGKIYWLAAHRPDAVISALLLEVTVKPLVTASERAAELGVSDAFPRDFDLWFSTCLERDHTQRARSARAACRRLAEILSDDAHAIGPLTPTRAANSSVVPLRDTPITTPLPHTRADGLHSRSSSRTGLWIGIAVGVIGVGVGSSAWWAARNTSKPVATASASTAKATVEVDAGFHPVSTISPEDAAAGNMTALSHNDAHDASSLAAPDGSVGVAKLGESPHPVAVTPRAVRTSSSARLAVPTSIANATGSTSSTLPSPANPNAPPHANIGFGPSEAEQRSQQQLMAQARSLFLRASTQCWARAQKKNPQHPPMDVRWEFSIGVVGVVANLHWGSTCREDVEFCWCVAAQTGQEQFTPQREPKEIEISMHYDVNP